MHLVQVLQLPVDEALEKTKIYCLYFVAIGVVMGLSTFTHIWAYGVAGEILTMRSRAMTFAAMIKQETAWFDLKSNAVGALCTRLSHDASNIQGVCNSWRESPFAQYYLSTCSFPGHRTANRHDYPIAGNAGPGRCTFHDFPVADGTRVFGVHSFPHWVRLFFNENDNRKYVWHSESSREVF